MTQELGRLVTEHFSIFIEIQRAFQRGFITEKEFFLEIDDLLLIYGIK